MKQIFEKIDDTEVMFCEKCKECRDYRTYKSIKKIESSIAFVRGSVIGFMGTYLLLILLKIFTS